MIATEVTSQNRNFIGKLSVTGVARYRVYECYSNRCIVITYSDSVEFLIESMHYVTELERFNELTKLISTCAEILNSVEP